MLKLSQPNISEVAIEAVVDVLRSGQLVHGSESDEFERELAEYLGCCEVVLVSSGTAALHVALQALDISRNDAVIVPDFTFPATANAVSVCGARPVVVDVSSQNYTIDPELLEEAVRSWSGPEKLRAIIAVHEFGHVANMAEINRIAQKYDLFVIEDAACALGAHDQGTKAGTFGSLGCFSFHPRKTLTTGEGGAISTNSHELASKMRALRNHGMVRSERGMQFSEPATNYRLTNFQAALGRKQLPELDDWINWRRSLVQEYAIQLQSLIRAEKILQPEQAPGNSWQTFMIVLGSQFDRDSVISSLRDYSIESNLGAQSLSSLDLWGEQSPSLKVGPRLYRQGLALPLFERMSLKDVETVSSSLAKVLNDR